MKPFLFTLLFAPFSLFSQGNPAMIEAKVEDVYSQFGLTGDGVIFAMIDRGIDYTHPAYLNDDGTTRIAYIFDMIDQTGANAPNNPYGVGTIFSESDINTSLTNGGTPLTTDRGGHGTATTGIATGNGGGTTNKEFKGVAHKATIIVVKMVLDAFPSFNGNPGQSGFYDGTYIPIALNFIKDKVVKLGLPSVTLMNIGSIGGPTDGTSSICQAIDNFIDDGHVFVCGAGDDGGGENHASGTINQGETIKIEVNKVSASLRFELWYSENDRFNVTIEQPNGVQYGPYTAPTTANDAVDATPSGVYFYHRGANQEFYGATSNRRNIFIDFVGSSGVYKIILEGATVSDGSFHATLNPAHYASSNAFLNYISEGTSINDFSSSFKVISPGDYVINSSWTDINGIPRSRPVSEGAPGEIWVGSSEGPTQDGRWGIDFVAPGEVIFAPYSPNTYYASFTSSLVQNGNSLYGIQNAVSAAAPLTCGIIALMLELDPTLTNDEIKSILQQTAKSDSYTGSVPNKTWGYGKIDALAAVNEVNNRLSLKSSNQLKISMYPNPVADRLTIESNETFKKAMIYNLQGQLIRSGSIKNNEINLEHLNSGLYFVKVENKQKIQTFKILKN